MPTTEHNFFEDMIPLARLMLDPENPRLPEVQASQRETIAALAVVQGSQLVALAKHIVANGLSPAELPIVIPTADDPRSYYVLDGNRRINALKVLETPELAQSALPPNEFKKLKKLSASYLSSPIEDLRCAVAPSREAADPWIQLRHRGFLEGAGTVAWSGQVAARYDERRGRRSPALQVIDFLKDHDAKLEPKTQQKIAAGRYPVTTLNRLLNTIYVREKLGLEKSGGILTSRHPSHQILPALQHITEKIGSRELTVSDLKSQKQRIDAINKIESSLLPSEEEEEGEETEPVALSQIGGTRPVKTPPKKRRVPPRRQRTTIIPKDFHIEIDPHRINAVYVELKALNADDFPNSSATMMRVFLELSVDHHLESKAGWPEAKIKGTNLQSKILAAAKVLEQAGALTANQLAPVQACANRQSILGPTYRTLHEYVHNYHHAPIPTELRTLWDNLQLFFQAIWK